jgi:branched-chain amino acid aminotransferase
LTIFDDENSCDLIILLDTVCSGQAIEEAGASNFFVVYPNNTIVTPSLDSQTILPGVTRASVMELAEKECGCTVLEGRLTLSNIKGACEAFCCGTGASITPVGSVSVANEDGSEDVEAGIVFGDGKTPGPLTERLYKLLLDLQTGADESLNEKYSDWIHIVEP